VKQSKGFRALHLNNWIFPNYDFRMIDPSSRLKAPNNIAAKILSTNESIALHHRRKIGAMHAAQSPGLCGSKQFLHQVRKLLEKLLIALAIAHVVYDIAVNVKRCERRGEHAKPD
jgi:hypothetical protein